jgi:hypothetical protein
MSWGANIIKILPREVQPVPLPGMACKPLFLAIVFMHPTPLFHRVPAIVSYHCLSRLLPLLGNGCCNCRRGLPRSSGCGTSAVAPRTAMRRSATATTPSRVIAAGPPARRTGSECVSAATMPRKRPVGASPLRWTKRAGTQPNSRRPPGCTIAPPRRRHPGRSR